MARFNRQIAIVIIVLLSIIMIVFSAINLKTGCDKYRRECYQEWLIKGKVCQIRVSDKMMNETKTNKDGIDCIFVTDKCYTDRNYICYLRYSTTRKRECPVIECFNPIAFSFFVISICICGASSIVYLYILFNIRNVIENFCRKEFEKNYGETESN